MANAAFVGIDTKLKRVRDATLEKVVNSFVLDLNLIWQNVAQKLAGGKDSRRYHRAFLELRYQDPENGWKKLISGYIPKSFDMKMGWRLVNSQADALMAELRKHAKPIHLRKHYLMMSEHSGFYGACEFLPTGEQKPIIVIPWNAESALRKIGWNVFYNADSIGMQKGRGGKIAEIEFVQNYGSGRGYLIKAKAGDLKEENLIFMEQFTEDSCKNGYRSLGAVIVRAECAIDGEKNEDIALAAGEIIRNLRR